AEEIFHREPGEARPLADAAVRDDRLIAGDPARSIERLQLVERLEGAVLVAVLPPRDALRARDMTTALAGFRQPRGREDFAGELLRAANVDQRSLLRRDRLLYF